MDKPYSSEMVNSSCNHDGQAVVIENMKWLKNGLLSRRGESATLKKPLTRSVYVLPRHAGGALALLLN